MTRADRRAAERRGRLAETMAALLLMLKGYRILERRYRTPVGEIDLVARRGGTLAFIEVKAHGAPDGALQAVARGRPRIVRAAEAYLSRHPVAASLTLRFDVVVVAPRRLPRHLADAFGADR